MKTKLLPEGRTSDGACAVGFDRSVIDVQYSQNFAESERLKS